jgi:heterotetrameric sarcosine oxidase gamma subunit
VSALDFLTPESPEQTVTARTPMERPAAAAGARFERREGWNIAAGFGDPALERRRIEETVAFADRSALVKLELHANPEVLAAVFARAGGSELVLGEAARAADAWWCPVTPSRLLVLGEPGAGPELRAAVSDPGATVVDVTCGLAAIALIGPGARELLARFCAIDVRPAITPVGGFRPGSVARTPGYVLVEDEHRLLVLVGWALGEYLWEVVADAAGNLGGGPVGADEGRHA